MKLSWSSNLFNNYLQTISYAYEVGEDYFIKNVDWVL